MAVTPRCKVLRCRKALSLLHTKPGVPKYKNDDTVVEVHRCTYGHLYYRSVGTFPSGASYTTPLVLRDPPKRGRPKKS